MHRDWLRAGSFGSAAEQYDSARPSYPTALIDDLVGLTGRRKPAVLDVGCGTGIVARQLVAAGAEVLGVEADARMAAVARGHGVAVEVGRFEEWDQAARVFDLVTAGQSWHWVDPAVGPGKAAAALRPGGYLAAFWNNYRHDPEALAAFLAVYDRYAPEMSTGSVALGTIPEAAVAAARAADIAAIDACGLFERPEERTYPWTRVYTADDWLTELPTHSGHATLPPATLAAVMDAMAAVVDSLGGRVVVEFETDLLLAPRLLALSRQ